MIPCSRYTLLRKRIGKQSTQSMETYALQKRYHQHHYHNAVILAIGDNSMELSTLNFFHTVLLAIANNSMAVLTLNFFHTVLLAIANNSMAVLTPNFFFFFLHSIIRSTLAELSVLAACLPAETTTAHVWLGIFHWTCRPPKFTRQD